MDKLANMSAFAAVGHTGSFAGAARKLNLTSSVISKRIKDLEDYLGTQLFVRTTRKVSLTDTGYNYLEYVQRVIDEMNEIESKLRFNSDMPIGTIKLAAPLSFGMQFLGPAIAQYLEKYPDINIKTYLSDRRADLTQEGYDLAIRIGTLEDSSMIAKKLGDCRRIVCASPAYFKKHGTPKSPSDLKDHNCMSYLNLADGKSWPFIIGGKRKWQAVSGKFSADNGELLYEAALQGCGIVMLPTFISGNALNDGRLISALEEYEDEHFNVYAVYQHNRHLSTKVRTFIDHMSDYFSDRLACA